MGLYNNDVASKAIADLRKRLDTAALDALRSGMDWVEGKMEDPDPHRFMRPFDIFQPVTIEMRVKAGPAEPGLFEPTEEWRVIRHADWLAAGRPGDVGEVEEIANPRCGCTSDVARRVIIDNGTCGKGGCPYGGDI